ncbi:MAG: hypothetical protein Q9163_006067 [Psora crenata]
MVKKLIRLALASEYSRTPIRRSDMSAKVMPPGTARRFPHILSAANAQLGAVFGMELTQLPQREKITITQKRAAQRAGTQSQAGGVIGASSSFSLASSANKSYILTSTLPLRYRVPEILPPAAIPSTSAEAAYTGFVTFMVSLIYLSPAATLSENRLEKHLKRMNADEYVLGGERKDNMLKRMIKEGYIIKVKERDQGGEETVDYVVGPRGKVEVGEKGVAGLVRTIYGKKDTEADELERRLVRSLGDVVIQKKNTRHDGGERVNIEGEAERDEAEAEAEPEMNGLIDGEASQRRRRRVIGQPPSGRQRTRLIDKHGEEDEQGEGDEEEEEAEDADDDGDDDE